MATIATALPIVDDYLTRPEAARMLRCSVSTMERMALDGSGVPFIKLGAGKKRARVVYRRSDIETWLRAQTFTSTSEYGK